ncbi:MAG: phosphoribosylglycinamide formyltransferase [Actinomycetota bacterium]|jgi:phosphoribosylglycinamide formyltransferase-1
MKRVVILASGSGTLAQAIIDAQLEIDIVAVISDKNDAPVLERAQKAHIETFSIPMMPERTEWDRELETLLAALMPDLVVSAGFMRILSQKIASRFKIINSHPALLPLFPGAHAVRDALAAGATETGTTIHWVDAGVDTGEVIAQERVEIHPDDTEESLHERIKIVERGLIVATVASLITTMEKKNG